jgi:cytochrome d ubiquinol oxidase subunit II
VTATLSGLAGIAGLFVLRADAPDLFDGLTGRALPVVAVSVLAGVAAFALLVTRRYVPARAASGLAVTAILVGWAVAQYPYVLVPDVTIEEAAGGRSTLTAMLVALVAGGAILLPALVYLYSLFQRAPEASAGR